MLVFAIVLVLTLYLFKLYMDDAKKYGCCYTMCSKRPECARMPPKYLLDRYLFDDFWVRFKIAYLNAVWF